MPLLTPPLLTIGIPAYNRPELLREALQLLTQRPAPFPIEIVICDDLGNPATAEVVARLTYPNLHYSINPTRLGPVGNWNRCLQLARGTWFTLLHEDDLLSPYFCESVAPHLTLHAAALAVRCIQGTTSPVFKPSRHGTPRNYPSRWFLKGAPTPFPGVVMRTELARALGGFSPAQGPLADYDFWYRLSLAGPFLTLPTVAAFYRVNPGQWTDLAWPEMVRRTHLLRLRIAQEQFPRHRRLGRWAARFFSLRNALSYQQRYGEDRLAVRRLLRFRRMPAARLPSGWVWRALRLLPSASSVL